MLKEKAKWSSDPEAKRRSQLRSYLRTERNAISELQEIMSITSDEDIRNACVEAIKSMRATLSSSSITNRNSNNNNNNNDSASQSNVGLN